MRLCRWGAVSVRVTFVTGTSCAGKTHLKAALDERGYLEIDGVLDVDLSATCRPSTAWLDWLHWRAAEHLHEATEAANDWLVVTGIVWPLSLVGSPAWAPARRAGVEVEFFLLHPPWKLVHERLGERLAGASRRELAELRRYNRRLRDTLLEQALAVRGGLVVRDVDLDDQLDLLFDADNSWRTEWRPS